MKKVMIRSSLVLSLFLLTGCDESVEKSVESSEEFKQLAGEFNSLVDDMELKDKVLEIEGKVSEGLVNAKDLTVDIVNKKNQKNKPVSDSETGLLKATVSKVVDGDTIDVYIIDDTVKGKKEKKLSGTSERVRLILIDTPESVGKYKNNPQPYALEASAFTSEILKGSTVWLQKGIQERDPYGRLLAYVWLKDISYELNGKKQSVKSITMNELLLQKGLAHVAIYPPNTEYLDEFKATESVAKRNKLGMWAEE